MIQLKCTSFFILLLCLQSFKLSAQTTIWAKNFQGTSQDYSGAIDIDIDSSNSIYTTGYFNGTMDFDPGIGVYNLSSNGMEDIFISKIDNNGNFIWAKSFGGIWRDQGTSVNIDSNGNIFLIGEFNGTIDFDTGVNNYFLSGNPGVFVLKLDTNGEFIWAKSFDAKFAYSSTLDSIGNIIITGNFGGITDFDPSSNNYSLSALGEDIFVSKLDANGDFMWAKSLVGIGYINKGLFVKVDNLGNIIFTGYFFGEIDLNPGLDNEIVISNGSMDIFIAKLSANGEFIWGKSIGGLDADIGESLAIDKLNNIILIGTYSSSVDFNTDNSFILNAIGLKDFFILKLDTEGNFYWVKTIGGTDNENASAIIIDKWNNIICAGAFHEYATFDVNFSNYNLNTFGASDIFLCKFSFDGVLKWARKMGGNNSEGISSMIVDNFGDILTTGAFAGTANFEPNDNEYYLNSNGGFDAFVQKITLNSYSNQSISACNSFLWNNNIYTSTGTFQDTIANNNQYDSIMTLNLNIINIDTTVFVGSNFLKVIDTTSNYQWLDCDNNFSILIGESNQVFFPNSSGNYAVILSGDCIDTSSCYNINLTGLSNINSTKSMFVNYDLNSSKILIKFNAEQNDIKIKIFNSFGQIIKEYYNFSGNEIILESTELMSGVYYVNLMIDQQIKTIEKLVLY